MPDSQEAQAFSERLPLLESRVVEGYKKSRELLRLIGENPVVMLEEAQRYLGLTLKVAYSFANPQLHIRILPWVYRSYLRHGFQPGYFRQTLELWIEAINDEFPEPEVYTELLEYLLSLDAGMRESGRMVGDSFLIPTPGKAETVELQGLLATLISNDEEAIEKALQTWFERLGQSMFSAVIEPVMYEVGRYWELDRISTPQEHQITALICNFLAALPRKRVPPGPFSILISPAPNEFHELGALIVADLFRQAGWRVHYLNAGASATEIIDAIGEHKPRIVAFSIALILHAERLRTLIEAVREAFPALPIMAGGRFLRDNPEVAETLALDGFALSADDAVPTALRIVDSRR